jgi:hypothetical protein|uniref:Uncharacterized protein n=1 Tax=viral metagenome TaxID=1070528 RepID=A0A6C0AKA2_9ZZZZ
MNTQMKNTMYILAMGVITQLIFWSFISPMVGAKTMRGLELTESINDKIPCKEGTNKTDCICPNTECLKFIEKTGGCHPIDCWKWDKYNSKCEPAGKEFIPAMILQGIPITGVFGSGFGNIGRWDIFSTYMGLMFGGCLSICCCGICCNCMANENEKVSATQAGTKCGSSLLSLAVTVLWIWGIVVIANREIEAPYYDWEGNSIICPLV